MPRLRTARHLTARWAADPHVMLAVAIVVAALAIELVIRTDDALLIVLPCAVYLALQLTISSVARLRPEPPALAAGRLLIAVGAVFLMSRLTADQGTFPLATLYVPIVAMGAVIGAREAAILGIASLAAVISVVASLPQTYPAMLQRGVALTVTTILIAMGTRRSVSSLERALAQLRRTSAAHRRRARQMAAIEEVGRVLAANGPTK
jgi:hypothetical protein